MGTSQSSKGSPAGVPMVPPWVPDIPDNQIPPNGESVQNNPKPENPTEESIKPQSQNPLAPKARFAGAKRSLTDFGRTGDRISMRKGVGRYVKKGYGGSSIAAKRLSGTVKTAQALYSALSGGLNSIEKLNFNLTDLAGKTAYEVMDAVVESIRPVDGTQDAEASRASIKDALSEVLTAYPDADLTLLNQEQKELAIESYVYGDVFRRIDLDLGAHIREKAPDTKSAMSRMKDIKDYVKETVAASFRKLKEAGNEFTGNQVTQIVQRAIQETCVIFEEYAE